VVKKVRMERKQGGKERDVSSKHKQAGGLKNYASDDRPLLDIDLAMPWKGISRVFQSLFVV